MLCKFLVSGTLCMGTAFFYHQAQDITSVYSSAMVHVSELYNYYKIWWPWPWTFSSDTCNVQPVNHVRTYCVISILSYKHRWHTDQQQPNLQHAELKTIPQLIRDVDNIRVNRGRLRDFCSRVRSRHDRQTDRRGATHTVAFWRECCLTVVWLTLCLNCMMTVTSLSSCSLRRLNK